MKSKRMILFLSLWLFLIDIPSNAQTSIADSLHTLIQTAKNENQKLTAILNYCSQYQSLNIDTAYNYALLALRMAKQTGDANTITKARLAFANAYYVWGWVDSALAVCNTALPTIDTTDSNMRDTYYKLLRQKAMCYGGIEQFPEALDILYELLRNAESHKDSLTLASTCNTIGSVNILMEKPGEALAWIQRALEYDTKEKSFLPIKASVLTNAAYAYMNKGKPDSAMQNVTAALPLSREAQNLNTLATALRIRSKLYIGMHKNDEAETDLREMIRIRRTLSGGSTSSIADDNLQIANFYAGTGQLPKAIAICKDNIKTGDIYNKSDSVSFNNHLTTRLGYYKALAGFYKQAGMSREYTSTLEDIIAAKDSLYTVNSAQALAEVQTKYETEQKEKTILQQKYDLTKKNILIFGSLALLLLSGIIFYLLFREYRRRQTAKMQLALQKEKLSKQAAVQEAEEKERRRIAADLHDNLGVQANAILYNAELLKQEGENNEALVDDLHDTAKQMLLNLRETLWAMKSNDINAAELWVRIISFSKQMGRHYSHIHFSTQGKAPSTMSVTSARALNIVMMIQEAVQNAVKHSAADKIVISSATTNEHLWQITVRDNGSGFAFAEAYAKPESHGLKNIQERAAAGGLQVDINSDKDKGTSVQIIVSE